MTLLDKLKNWLNIATLSIALLGVKNNGNLTLTNVSTNNETRR
jgi:hypothetical protein